MLNLKIKRWDERFFSIKSLYWILNGEKPREVEKSLKEGEWNYKKGNESSLPHSCLFCILILRTLELLASLGRNPRRRWMVSIVRQIYLSHCWGGIISDFSLLFMAVKDSYIPIPSLSFLGKENITTSRGGTPMLYFAR